MMDQLIALCLIGSGHAAQDPWHPQSRIDKMLEIRWEEGNPFPWTYNGGSVGRIGDYVVYMTGFGRRVPDELKSVDGYYDGYHRLLAAYHIPSQRWEQVRPLFPGKARAYGVYSVSDGVHAYCVGGQSYEDPFCFRDVYRWERLPDLPCATAEAGCVLLNRTLYVFGGDHYAMEGPHKGWDSTVENVGRRLHTLDLDEIEAGWRALKDCPGTPRSHHALAPAGGKLYALGGIFSHQGKHWNCVDNWCYDPAKDDWSRVRDLPIPCGGWSSKTWKDRFILLFGGYWGREIRNPDGSTRPPYGCDSASFSNSVLVYDATEDLFSEANPMPRAINDPRLVWLDDHTVMNVTGEIPGGRRIPCVLVGHLR